MDDCIYKRFVYYTELQHLPGKLPRAEKRKVHEGAGYLVPPTLGNGLTRLTRGSNWLSRLTA